MASRENHSHEKSRHSTVIDLGLKKIRKSNKNDKTDRK